MTTPAQAESPDARLAGEALAVELAARDLYEAAIGAGASGELWSALRDQHQSYGQRLAGVIGVSANTVDSGLVDELTSQFAVADPASAAAALENRLAAEHAERLAEVSNAQVVTTLAAIVAAESRHAVVAAQRAGVTDPAELYVNPNASTTTEADA